MEVLMKHEACTSEVSTFEQAILNECDVTTGNK